MLIQLLSFSPSYILFLPPILLLCLALYRVIFTPLHPVPGPLLNRLTSLPLYYHSYIGTEASYLHRLHARYGPIVRIAPNDISVQDPGALHAIYIEKGGFPKAACYANFDIDGHQSIFSALTKEHRAPRAKAVVGMFAAGVLREKAQQCIERVAGEFVEKLQEVKDAGKRGGKGKVNVLDLARAAAVDAVTGYLFARSYGGLGEGNLGRSEEHVGGQQHLSAGAFVDTFVAVGRFFLLPNIAFKAVEWLSTKLFPDTKVDKSMGLVYQFVDDLVEDTATSLDGGGDRGQDDDEDTYQRRLLNAGFSKSETKAQCLDLIFAGTDSTGMNLATACWYLSQMPDLYNKLRTELVNNPAPVSLTIDPATHPLLASTLRETLRISMANPTRFPRVVPSLGFLYTPSPSRTPWKTSRSTSYFLPAGTQVGLSPYNLHLDNLTFPEPYLFKPERWLDDKVTPEMNLAHIPFGLGPRQCIARNLAMAELSVALRLVIESGVLETFVAVGGVEVAGNNGESVQRRIEILEWFNSKVVAENVELCVK